MEARRVRVYSGVEALSEVDRLRRAGIVDHEGNVIPQTMPVDMDPASCTSVLTV